MKARLTRRYRFAAAHRLHAPWLTPAENREIYGKCNNPHGHGHDYVLEVTIYGEVDARTGRVGPVGKLDRLVRERVLAELAHADLSRDVPAFAQQVPTTENLVQEIGRRLRESWLPVFGPSGPQLDRIRLHETRRNMIEAEFGPR